MTIKLYQQDSYLREMDARVLDRVMRDGKPALLLDQTVFYPTSGGQMHDTGYIAGVRVEDVVIEGEEIWHLLADTVDDASVHGILDWPRRFDFMQQHTGFHLLAGAFFQSRGIRTLAAHLGEEESTIEVDAGEVTAGQLEEIETLANRIIWENRPVDGRLVGRNEAELMNLRKTPQVAGTVRLIAIEDFDLDPCGGTHVSTTGQVGVVKFTARERIRQGTRFSFVAGGRALRLVQNHARILGDLCQLMTTEAGKLAEGMVKLQDENKTLRKSLQQKIQLLAEQQLDSLCALAGQARVVSHLFPDGDLEIIRFLAASAVRKRPGIYLFGGTAGRAALAFACSDTNCDLRPAFAAAILVVEGRGGGEASFIQGSGPRIDKIEEALRIAQNILEKC
jgi:alanyl-tRNA synthetase